MRLTPSYPRPAATLLAMPLRTLEQARAEIEVERARWRRSVNKLDLVELAMAPHG